jgi:hypothetical protein
MLLNFTVLTPSSNVQSEAGVQPPTSPGVTVDNLNAVEYRRLLFYVTVKANSLPYAQNLFELPARLLAERWRGIV